ncbi:MAG: PIN domain-containing protein, partial [Syntrophales bacterium]|nr:PIN domain-containing protein [Syntrophales bacterium]
MTVIFLDTNVFMQCKDLKVLPWKDVANSNEILLLIPLTVEKEIDKQKGEGGSRRGKRARAISSFFKKIVTSGETRFVINQINPTIELAFSDIHPLRVDSSDALDATRPDDLIIAEILQYKRSNPDHDVHFLTHDSYPMRACQRLGIAFQAVPDEWLLEPEDDPRDKALKELRLKITKLEQNYPQIELQIRNSDNKEVSKISTELTVYAGLTEAQVNELVAEAVALFPMKTEFKIPNKPKASSAFSDRNFARLLGSQEEYQEPSESLVNK